MQLQLCTWPQVEDYLKTSTGIIMPIGSTEQHGPTGLIGTDAITAQTIGRALGEATGAMVGPTIPVGMAHHHMEFPGSMTLKPSTLIAVIRDYVLSLSEHGFRHFLFVNGHGGNIASVTAAFYEIYSEARALRGADAPALRCRLSSWFEGPRVMALSRELFGNADGSHATAGEVSVTWHVHPETMHARVLEPRVAPNGRFFDARDFRRRFADGRMGSDPSLATPEHGERLIATAVEELTQVYRSLLAEG